MQVKIVIEREFGITMHKTLNGDRWSAISGQQENFVAVKHAVIATR